VIFCRDSLHELPYSVEEIYEIKTSGKNHSFKKMYGHDTSFVYGKGRSSARPKPDAVLTEDSGSGYQFYKHYFESRDIECFTSGGNSGVFRWVMENKGRRVFIIADGAAFGSEIDRVLKIASSSDMTLCLPESFEWLILRSGLIKGASEKILDDPSSYIDSKDHFSWERYFTQYLVELTDRPENAPFKYYSDKGRIAEAYLIDINAGKIISIIID
ncbi:MAG: translation initiation factor 2, partial [Oscillospiraceae bacterium]|nr:translation initiation factor 2 [Oscillospiraceae bacterium]